MQPEKLIKQRIDSIVDRWTERAEIWMWNGQWDKVNRIAGRLSKLAACADQILNEMENDVDQAPNWEAREVEFLQTLNETFTKYRVSVLQSDSQENLKALYQDYKNAITEYENALREEQRRRSDARIQTITLADLVDRFQSENLLIALQNVFYQYTFAGNEKTLANDILTYLENRHYAMAQSRKAE